VKLNRIETFLVNNSLRSILQRRLELPGLLKMAPKNRFKKVLEVGCGRGIAAKTLLEHYERVEVDALDIDERMLRLARIQLSSHPNRSRLWQADVARIPVRANQYDAVFDFAILHHLQDWRKGLAEIARVLKPGGVFYGTEMLDRFVLHPLIRGFLEHPLEDRFNSTQFLDTLEENHLQVLESRDFSGWMLWWAARKQPQQKCDSDSAISHKISSNRIEPP